MGDEVGDLGSNVLQTNTESIINENRRLSSMSRINLSKVNQG